MRHWSVRSSLVALGLTVSFAASGCVIYTHPAPQQRSTTYSEPSYPAQPAPVARPAPVTRPAPIAQPAPVTPERRPTTPAEPGASRRYVEVSGRRVPVIIGRGVFGTDQEAPNTLRGVIYFIPERSQRLPDLSLFEPQGAFYTTEINVPTRSFREGFPGVNGRYEWFALRYEGQFTVSADGPYAFRLYSDDGSKLWIDNALVADNDGLHAQQSVTGQVRLRPGTHTLRLDYYQGPGADLTMQLFVTPPSASERLFTTRL
jgi:hypothetical protein